ncbi:class I SAM-dependent methyltransferase [Thiohalorhabdus methylotrophus]|uniref:Class I SAM-dependent methyltransferase n=1 Tax=Thiohalorhabdus methylotrophus TaxID=3242694 RepID=A0ABV4TRF1_9GAMM
MDLSSVEKAYKRLAGTYDTFFGAIFQPGRKAVLEHIDLNPGEKVLEMGVGTGLSLPLYPRDVDIYGIDISEPMLEKARQKKVSEHLENVKLLEVMDAEETTFEDDSFDVVVAAYVVTTVPDPARCIDEMRRVCKPDGELVIVNHFQSENPIVGGVERALAPLSSALGWRPNMRQRDLEAETSLEVVEQHRVNLFGYWSMLKCRNNKEAIASKG